MDKAVQFAAEIEASGIDAEERLVALKFLLHLIGDMHQPLHASDNHDAGGNAVKVIVDGFDHKSRDSLHGYWDTQFVDALGRPPAALAKQLLAQITPEREAEWKQGAPDEWAREAFDIAFDAPTASRRCPTTHFNISTRPTWPELRRMSRCS